MIGLGVVRALLVRPADVGPVANGGIVLDSRVEDVYATTAGIGLAQFILAAVVIVSVTGEYSSGTIGLTVAASGRRLPVLAAKALVTMIVVAACGLVALVLTAAVTAPIHQRAGFQPDLFGASTLGPIVGGTGYLVLMSVLALGMGGIIRSAVIAIGAFCAMLTGFQALFNVVADATKNTPLVWIGNIGQFLPIHGDLLFQQIPGIPHPEYGIRPDGTLTVDPGQALIVIAAWALLSLIVWAVLFTRRKNL